MSLPCLRLVEILSEWRPCFVLIFHHLAVDLLEVLVALGIQPRLRFTILLWLVLREKKGLGEAQKSSLIFRVPRADMWRCAASTHQSSFCLPWAIGQQGFKKAEVKSGWGYRPRKETIPCL